MDVINYHPWTLIYLNLVPSIGLVGNWEQWSNAETDLIKKVKQDNKQKKLTILNFLMPKTKAPIIGLEAMKSLGERNGVQQIINYGVPPKLKNLSHKQDLNGFEPLKNMLHLEKIYVLKNHPLINILRKIYQSKQLEIIEPTQNQSFTRNLKEALSAGDLAKYQQLTGANYTFRGTIIHGLGHRKLIEYPTANILTEPLLPIRSGVYLVKIHLPNENKGRWGLGDYRKLKNHKWAFETFILDFNQQIYDWVVTIELITFHRDNVSIKSLDQLKQLISNDEITLRKLIKKIKGE